PWISSPLGMNQEVARPKASRPGRAGPGSPGYAPHRPASGMFHVTREECRQPRLVSRSEAAGPRANHWPTANAPSTAEAASTAGGGSTARVLMAGHGSTGRLLMAAAGGR